MSRNIQSLVAIVILLLGGYGSWRLILAFEPAPPSAPPRDVGPPRITHEILVPRDLTLEVQAFGNLEASQRAFLTAEVSARIVAVFEGWRPGAEIQAGERLVLLDETLFALDVANAEASLAEAAAALQVIAVEEGRALKDQSKLSEALGVATRQYQRLVELGRVASDLQRDSAQSNKLNAERALEVAGGAVALSQANELSALARQASAEAALARAVELMARCQIKAPFSGRLRGHAPGLGTLATPGLILAELVDPNSIVLQVHVPERDLLLLKPGMKTRLVFPNTPETDEGPDWEGRVTAVDIASDPLTRRGLVEIELDAEEREVVLPAGLFARAMIEVEQMHDVIWIDRRHFRWEGSQAVAYVVGSGPAGPEQPVSKRRVLTLWREHGEGFVVTAGLQAGDRLITLPLDRMGEDQPVALGQARPARDLTAGVGER